MIPPLFGWIRTGPSLGDGHWRAELRLYCKSIAVIIVQKKMEKRRLSAGIIAEMTSSISDIDDTSTIEDRNDLLQRLAIAELGKGLREKEVAENRD